MPEEAFNLSDSVEHVSVDGRDIYLVGTAHVSRESVEDVKATVEAVKPDTICVELCASRHKAMTDKDNWKQMDVFKVIKEKKAVLLLAQLIMSGFYKRLGEKLGVQPGAEMLEGVKQAQQTGAELVLADRDIQITLKRVWGYLGFWSKLRLASHLMAGLFSKEKIDDELVEEMKQKDQLESVMAEFAGSFPEIKRRLIDERDIYLAQQIRQSKGKTVVAVVGAGHIKGMKEHLYADEDINELIQIPRKSFWPVLLKWGIPALIVALFAIGFIKGGKEHSIDNLWIWIGINGSLSALGAAAARGHILTVISAFLAAPLTSLNPLMAAGWVAGLVQAWAHRPTVADFEDLPDALTSLKKFWANSVIKILLVVVLANLGSSLGTFISIGWIGARSF